MFDRTYIKVMARARLSQGMGAAIAVALVAALLGGSVQGSSGPTFRFTWNVGMEWNNRLFLLLSMAFLIVLLAILYSIFLGNVIGVGMRGWFLRYQRGQFPPVGEMFASFRIYIPSVATMLLRNHYPWMTRGNVVLQGCTSDGRRYPRHRAAARLPRLPGPTPVPLL